MATAVVTRPARGSGPPPPARNVDGHGGGSRWVELLVAANDIEAHLISGRLAEAGVEVRVLKDRSAPGAWLYGGSNPWAPVRILVRELQLVDARIVMAEVSFDAPPAHDGAIDPPSSHRSRPLVWWSLALGLGMLFTSVALARTAAVIDRCDLPLLCGDHVTSP